jgi:NodT family efflux transporter outer membrane factor (OMF) lipoprotein
MKRICYCIFLFFLSACSLAPKYERPELSIPVNYKEAGKWIPANPTYANLDRGPWWRIYRDPILNGLEVRVTLANQNLKIAFQRYQEACALAAVARADFYPTITADPAIQRIKNSSNTALVPPSQYNDMLLGANLSYEIDVWGRVRNRVAAAQDQARASAADLAAVDLSLHAELASDYFALRGDDEGQRILDSAVKAYTVAYDLNYRRHKGGAAPEADVDQARAQLESAKTLAADNRLKRARLEHAIAVLIGVVPAQFNLPETLHIVRVVSIAPKLPSTLLERRPDIAAAELRVQAANAQIGVARAAYFPTFNLLGGLGFESAVGYNLLSAPSLFWSLGPQATWVLFDGGRISAFVHLAQARYFESVADYRQTTLMAFQEVEDNLVAIHRLNQEMITQAAAVAAAYRAEQQAKYRYKGGIINYLEVVFEQNIALQADLINVDIKIRRQQASVQLIRALGGGWPDLPINQ